MELSKPLSVYGGSRGPRGREVKPSLGVNSVSSQTLSGLREVKLEYKSALT